MKGNEALKKYREDRGYSLRQLADLLNVTSRVISYYESGEYSFSSMPVFKAVALFNILDVEIEKFVDIYYPFKGNINYKISLWKIDNPRMLNYESLSKRYASKFSKFKVRKNLSENEIKDILQVYKDSFKVLKSHTDASGNISEADYEQYILPLQYLIKRGERTEEELEASVNGKIMKALYNTEFSLLAVAEMCGVNSKHLSGCLNGTYDIQKIHVGVALKLCYVLNLDFKDTFQDKNIG